MSLLTLAVISDIHIGNKARSSDLLPPGCTAQRRDEQFLIAFDRFASKTELSADCLVIAGDLSSQAGPDEFLHASTIARRIASALNVPNGEIYFVPGNHDVDWNVLKLAQDTNQATRELRWAQRYAPITTTDNLFISRATDSKTNQFSGSLFTSPFAGIWPNTPHLFVAINTAAHDCQTEPIHYGLVREETIDWLYANVAQRVEGDQSVRCLVLHHHIVPHGNIGHASRDFSVCQNADRLLTAIRQLDFDLVIHGHKHLPRFETQLVNSDHPLVILGAGSFSADLAQEYGSGVQNQFHLLTIDGRDATNSRICGVLRNWAYVFPNGWTENVSQYTVVDHLVGFGGPLDWKELAKILHQPIKTRALAGKPFDLASIGPIQRQLVYVSPTTAKRAIEEIARVEKLDVAWVAGPTLSAFFR